MKDRLGKEIKKGDRILYAVRRGDVAELNEGVVLDVVCKTERVFVRWQTYEERPVEKVKVLGDGNERAGYLPYGDRIVVVAPSGFNPVVDSPCNTCFFDTAPREVPVPCGECRIKWQPKEEQE